MELLASEIASEDPQLVGTGDDDEYPVFSELQPTKIATQNVALNLITRQLSVNVDGRELVRTLTLREAQLLQLLIENHGKVVTREAITEYWGTFGKNVDSRGNATDVYVNYLRKVIDKVLGKEVIQTVRGLGYRFVDN